LLMAGCLGEEQPENVTEVEEPELQQPENFSIVRFAVVHDTPGTRAVGKPWTQVAAIDFTNKRYALADPENYMVLAYVNDTYYRAVRTTPESDCFLTTSQKDFYEMGDDEIPMALFIFFEAIRQQYPDMYENATNSLQDQGDGEYLAYVAGLQNSTYRKYGDSYFGSNVTFFAGNETYNFVYYNVGPATEDEFDLFLNAKLEHIEGCTKVSG